MPGGERRRRGLSLASMRVLDSGNSLGLGIRPLGGLGSGLSVGETFCGCIFVDGGVSKTLL